jgi:hypothetical protein
MRQTSPSEDFFRRHYRIVDVLRFDIRTANQQHINKDLTISP